MDSTFILNRAASSKKNSGIALERTSGRRMLKDCLKRSGALSKKTVLIHKNSTCSSQKKIPPAPGKKPGDTGSDLSKIAILSPGGFCFGDEPDIFSHFKTRLRIPAGFIERHRRYEALARTLESIRVMSRILANALGLKSVIKELKKQLRYYRKKKNYSPFKLDYRQKIRSLILFFSSNLYNPTGCEENSIGSFSKGQVYYFPNIKYVVYVQQGRNYKIN